MKLSKKVLASGLALTMLVGGAVSAYSFDTFFGGVTGAPGRGTVWGMYSPSGRRVAVYAKGKTTSTAYANPGGTAHAVAQRAVSSNRSWWSYR